MTTLVLASGSPRRRELLARLVADFTVAPADVDETPRPDEPAHELVRRLAVDKAQAGLAAASGADDVVVLAADTVVVVDGDVLGKPVDAADAVAMLRRLSGRSHLVLTGVAVAGRHPGEVAPSDHDLGAVALAAGTGVGLGPAVHLAVEVAATEVDVAVLTDDEVAAYVATGEPLDKAGAYGIQGGFGVFVTAIRGTHENVVGLPLHLTRRLLLDAGIPVGVGRGQPPEV